MINLETVNIENHKRHRRQATCSCHIQHSLTLFDMINL